MSQVGLVQEAAAVSRNKGTAAPFPTHLPTPKEAPGYKKGRSDDNVFFTDSYPEFTLSYWIQNDKNLFWTLQGRQVFT